MTKEEYQRSLNVQAIMAQQGELAELAKSILTATSDLLLGLAVGDKQDRLLDIMQAAELILRRHCVDVSDASPEEYIDLIKQDLTEKGVLE